MITPILLVILILQGTDIQQVTKVAAADTIENCEKAGTQFLMDNAGQVADANTVGLSVVVGCFDTEHAKLIRIEPDAKALQAAKPKTDT